MLQATYDNEADALYVTLMASTGVATTHELDPGTLVDLDSTGAVVGIEVLHPGRMWPVAEVIHRYGIGGLDRKLLEVMFPQIGGPKFAFASHEADGSATTHQVGLTVGCA
jgi:uncharacterized protein YuzE